MRSSCVNLTPSQLSSQNRVTQNPFLDSIQCSNAASPRINTHYINSKLMMAECTLNYDNQSLEASFKSFHPSFESSSTYPFKTMHFKNEFHKNRNMFKFQLLMQTVICLNEKKTAMMTGGLVRDGTTAIVFEIIVNESTVKIFSFYRLVLIWLDLINYEHKMQG